MFPYKALPPQLCEVLSPSYMELCQMSYDMQYEEILQKFYNVKEHRTSQWYVL